MHEAHVSSCIRLGRARFARASRPTCAPISARATWRRRWMAAALAPRCIPFPLRLALPQLLSPSNATECAVGLPDLLSGPCLLLTGRLAWQQGVAFSAAYHAAVEAAAFHSAGWHCVTQCCLVACSCVAALPMLLVMHGMRA